MFVTREHLQQIMPNAKNRIDTFLPYINEAIVSFGMNITAFRMFIAQLAVESGEFKYTKELASGAAYDTGRLARALGNTPEADGDGQFYKGRGLIQITGHDNYAACGKALGLDLLRHPELLEQPEWAVKSAFWYYASRHLEKYTYEPTLDNFKAMTKAINGGYNGLQERIKYWERAKKVQFTDGGAEE